jgi:trimethyllysine dioxygenase
MCGAYIGADEFHSRLAVLSEQFATQGDLKTTGTGERGVWSQEF